MCQKSSYDTIKLHMIPEIKSKASFYGLPTNKFIVGQKYEFKLKIINKGADFSGGTIEILIVHADTMQRIELTGKIPEIKKKTKLSMFYLTTIGITTSRKHSGLDSYFLP